MQVGVIKILKNLISKYENDMFNLYNDDFLLPRKIAILDLSVYTLENNKLPNNLDKYALIQILEIIKKDCNTTYIRSIDYTINYINNL